MNKYVLALIVAVFGAVMVAAAVGMKYSQAAMLFGLVAAMSAPVVIHKISDRNWSIIMLLALAQFASFPMKKLFQIEGFIDEFIVVIVYSGILWTIGLGWRRTWS